MPRGARYPDTDSPPQWLSFSPPKIKGVMFEEYVINKAGLVYITIGTVFVFELIIETPTEKIFRYVKMSINNTIRRTLQKNISVLNVNKRGPWVDYCTIH